MYEQGLLTRARKRLQTAQRIRRDHPTASASLAASGRRHGGRRGPARPRLVAQPSL